MGGGDLRLKDGTRGLAISSQISRLWIASDVGQGEPDEAYITLRNYGVRIPAENETVKQATKFLMENIPAVKGSLGTQCVTVLRDTNCNTVIVRKSLVPAASYMDSSRPVCF